MMNASSAGTRLMQVGISKRSVASLLNTAWEITQATMRKMQIRVNTAAPGTAVMFREAMEALVMRSARIVSSALTATPTRDQNAITEASCLFIGFSFSYKYGCTTLNYRIIYCTIKQPPCQGRAEKTAAD